MEDLNDKHSGVYMAKVLIKTLEKFNIKLDIKRFVFLKK